MLDLKKDLYVRLVLSAHKNSASNKSFKTAAVDKSDNSSLKSVIMPSKLDETISNLPVPKSNNILIVSKPKPVEKIDEKVEKIIADPVLLEIKAELEFAEALLKKIKSVDKNNPKIPTIEKTVSQLKSTLEQKMYI